MLWAQPGSPGASLVDTIGWESEALIPILCLPLAGATDKHMTLGPYKSPLPPLSVTFPLLKVGLVVGFRCFCSTYKCMRVSIAILCLRINTPKG